MTHATFQGEKQTAQWNGLFTPTQSQPGGRQGRDLLVAMTTRGGVLSGWGQRPLMVQPGPTAGAQKPQVQGHELTISVAGHEVPATKMLYHVGGGGVVPGLSPTLAPPNTLAHTEQGI